MGADTKKIDLIEKAFKGVIDGDVHQDNKAGRILSAMAFLTAAAAAIFSKAYLPSSSTTEIEQKLTQGLASVQNGINPSVIHELALSLQKPHATLFGIDWSIFSFTGYIICVLIGAIFYLAALGPSFNIPSQFRKAEGEAAPKSLLFFKKIAEVTSEQWKSHWDKDIDELQPEMEKNYIYETHLIAVKTKTKVDLMLRGNISFKFAFLFLACLLSSFFAYDIVLVQIVILLLAVLLSIALYIEKVIRDAEDVNSSEKRESGTNKLLIAIWVLIGTFLFFLKSA